MAIPRLVYVGHATVLIELDGTRVLTDPVLRNRTVHLRRHTPVDADAVADLDVVLISHLHYDHFDRASLRGLGRDVMVVVPRGARRLLRGFRDVRELTVGEEVQVGGIRICATEAEHPGGARPTVWSARALGYLISGSRTVYFAGDTDLFDGMSTLAPGLDLALLPVAGWGPRVGPGHLDPERAAEAVRRLQPRLAIPIHWGTLATPGNRPSNEPPEVFRRLVAKSAPDVEVRVLTPGAATSF